MCESVEKGEYFPHHCSGGGSGYRGCGRLWKAVGALATTTTTDTSRKNLLGYHLSYLHFNQKPDRGEATSPPSVVGAITYRIKLRSQVKTEDWTCYRSRNSPKNLPTFDENETTAYLEKKMGPAKFPCPICTTKFDSPKDLGVHILKDHSDGDNTEENGEEEDKKPDLSELQTALPDKIKSGENNTCSRYADYCFFLNI